MLEEQEQLVPLLTSGFAMIRLMLPPGMQVVGLLRKAVAADRESFLIVNNKAEGSAPLTITGIAEMLASRWNGGANDEGAEVPREIPPLAG